MMVRPYLAPGNDGGSDGADHVVDLDILRSRAAPTPAAPWESPARPPASRPLPQAARRPPPPEPEPEPEPESLALGEGVAADQFTDEDARSFWSLPEVPPVAVPVRPEPTPMPEVSLSGPGDDFDAATGWSFPSIQVPDELLPTLSDAERSQPVLASADELFGEAAAATVPAWLPDETGPPPGDPGVSAGAFAQVREAASSGVRAPAASVPLPPPGPVPPPHDGNAELVTALLARGREMLSGGETDRAMRVLLRARGLAPSHPGVATWLEFGERRLLKQHCGEGKPSSVIALAVDRAAAIASADEVERGVLRLVDGKRCISEVLAETSADGYLPQIEALGRLAQRGTVRWD